MPGGTVILVVLLLVAKYQARWSPEDTTGLVAAIHQHFHSRCAFLILPEGACSNGIQITAEYVSVWKTLFEDNIQISLMEESWYLPRRWLIKCQQRPLFTLSLDYNEAKEFLLQIDRETMWGFTGVMTSFKKSITPHRDPVWLLLADNRNSMNSTTTTTTDDNNTNNNDNKDGGEEINAYHKRKFNISIKNQSGKSNNDNKDGGEENNAYHVKRKFNISIKNQSGKSKKDFHGHNDKRNTQNDDGYNYMNLNNDDDTEGKERINDDYIKNIYIRNINKYWKSNRTNPRSTTDINDSKHNKGRYNPNYYSKKNTNNFLQDVFFNINIPFDCEFLVANKDGDLVTLTEVYSVETRYRNEVLEGKSRSIQRSKINGTDVRSLSIRFPSTAHFREVDYSRSLPVVQHSWGNWSAGRLNRTRSSFYSRRGDLRGEEVRVISIPVIALMLPAQNEPFTLLGKDSAGRTVVQGFVGEVWRVLEKQMNFTTRVRVPEIRSQQRASEMLVDKMAIVALFDLAVNSPSFRSLHFSSPLFTSRYCVYIRHPDRFSQGWVTYLKPFSVDLWLASGAMVLGVALQLSASSHCVRRYGTPEAEDRDAYILRDALLCAFGMFCAQGQVNTPRSASCRYVFLLGVTTSAILLTAYSANLIAYLATQDSQLPFTDLQGLLMDGSYKFDVKEGSAGDTTVLNTADGALKALYTGSNLRNRPKMFSMFPRSDQDTLQQLCDSRRALFMQRDYALAYVNNVSCDVTALPGFSMPVSVALAVHRGNPYLPLINRNLNRMREAGVLRKMFNAARPEAMPEVKTTAPEVSLQCVKPLLGVLLLGVMASTVLLLLECAVHAKKRRKCRLALQQSFIRDL